MANPRILLSGAKGRMGVAIAEQASAANFDIAGAIDIGDNPADLIANCDVVIDFSHHTATAALVALAAQHGKAVVIGTTGHSEAEKKDILAHQSTIPIVWAGNYSVGVNLLFFLTQKAAEILGQDYHPEILELHHCHKKDAPSGTALNLAEAIQSAADFQDSPLRNGREGVTGERDPKEIGMHAIRGGEIVGEHTAFFIGPNDRIELTHRASDRGIFASGALRAAAWATQQAAGLYNMRDVLGFR
ncbi:MAG: 4-hydroxy-tetrahydrodipicolinate reductase [Opitutales bacterium]|nr:4-hydroxy-tetrahydrodipicolinate reductase [Opitutales bacterium]